MSLNQIYDNNPATDAEAWKNIKCNNINISNDILLKNDAGANGQIIVATTNGPVWQNSNFAESHSFYARRNASAQTITGAGNLILFATVQTDVGDHGITYNAGTFTFSKAQFVRMNVGSSFTGTSTVQYRTLKNGVSINIGCNIGSATTVGTSYATSLNGYFFVAPGDTLAISLFVVSAVNVSLLNGLQTIYLECIDYA